jgi:hypothetical protein
LFTTTMRAATDDFAPPKSIVGFIYIISKTPCLSFIVRILFRSPCIGGVQS